MPEPAHDITAEALLAEHAAEWLAAVARRHSRRAFNPSPVHPATLAEFAEFCRTWRPYQDARVVLAEHPARDIFTGIIGSYGKVTGAPHVIVFLGREDAHFVDQHVGYAGEAAVLEATRLGLATCWVGGFFSPKRVAEVVAVEPGERAYAVSPLGWARPELAASERLSQSLSGAHARKSVAELAPGALDGSWPPWAVAAVETARLAPSAMNRQPWRFRYEHGGLVVAKDSPREMPKVTKRLDAGIAMLHVELAARAHGVVGTWIDLAGTDVARFEPSGATRT